MQSMRFSSSVGATWIPWHGGMWDEVGSHNRGSVLMVHQQALGLGRNAGMGWLLNMIGGLQASHAACRHCNNNGCMHSWPCRTPGLTCS